MEPFTTKTFPIDRYPFPAVLISYAHTDCKVINANESFISLHGLSGDDLMGMDLFVLDLFSGKENEHSLFEKLREALSKATQANKYEKVYHAVECKDITSENGSIWMIAISPLPSSEDKPILLISFHDISGLHNEQELLHKLQHENEETSTKKELRNKILQADTQSKALTEELNNFMYSVSHDLRAPLRRIDGFSQELMNEYVQQLDETGAHYLSRIRQGAQDMGILIDELLKLSRLSRRTVNRQQIDIGPIAHDVFDELLELENDRDILIRIDENLDANADPGLVKILLMNLLSNALKFTKNEEKAEITVGQTERKGEKVFFVKDNGAGFDPDHADKLFKAFSRLHSQRVYIGSGIGLATVKRIITLHGGYIWGEGHTGEGAAFYFNFE